MSEIERESFAVCCVLAKMRTLSYYFGQTAPNCSATHSFNSNRKVRIFARNFSTKTKLEAVEADKKKPRDEREIE
jgi:hypothetical protein